MWCPVITLCDFDYSRAYIFYYFVCFFVFSSLLCRVSMYVCVLVDFIFCSYLMGSCQCFVAFLSSSLWIATACDCRLLEQNKMNEWMNEKEFTRIFAVMRMIITKGGWRTSMRQSSDGVCQSAWQAAAELTVGTYWYRSIVPRLRQFGKKVAHTRLPNVGFRSWSRFLAVSPQVTWVINPTVGCLYFSPGLQLPPQPLRKLLPILLLGEQRHNGCEQFA